MKVLLAIDNSQFAAAALDEIGSRPWWGDTEFLVVYVAALPTVEQWKIWGMEVDWPLRERLLAEAEKMVCARADDLRKMLTKGLKVESKIVESDAEGHISEAIVREAEAWDADLVVVGSHGYTGVKKFLLGSVSENVLMQATCSVEIIRSTKVKQDGSDANRKEASYVS